MVVTPPWRVVVRAPFASVGHGLWKKMTGLYRAVYFWNRFLVWVWLKVASLTWVWLMTCITHWGVADDLHHAR